jgi:hypothetical protein
MSVHVRSGAALAALAVWLAGCANGSTSSFTQAPIFFSDSYSDEGVYANAQDTATFSDGLGSYRLAGGNAFLPVSAALNLGTAQTSLDVQGGGLASAGAQLSPGQAAASANLLNGAIGGAAGVNVTGGQISTAGQANVGALGLGVQAGAAPGQIAVATAVQLGGANVTVDVPVATPTVATPAPISNALVTTSGLLGSAGATATTATSGATAVVNPLITGVLATQKMCGLNIKC